MYFPTLIVTTTSVWENKNQIKKKKKKEKGIHAEKEQPICVWHTGEIVYGVVLPKKSYL